MSDCIENLYDNNLVNKSFKCRNKYSELNFNKDKTKKVGIRSICTTCAEQKYSDNGEKRKLRDRKRREVADNFRLNIHISCRTNRLLTGKSIYSPTIDILGKDNKT